MNEKTEDMKCVGRDIMITKWCDRFFHILFFVLFSIITVGVIGSIFGVNFWGVVTAVGMVVLGVVVISLLYRRFGNIGSKKANIVFLIMAAVMLGLQLVAANLLLANPVTDWNVIHQVALSFAKNGTMDNMYENLPYNVHYLAKYTNNNGIAVLLSVFYRAVYMIFGDVPLIAPVILNTVFIFVSVILCYLIAKRILGNFGGIVTAGFCFLFMPYYTYTPYFYTDSISMPFTVLSVYLFIRAYDSNKTVSETILYCACACSIAVGYLLKGNVIIVLVGVIVYTLIKGGIKKLIFGVALTLSVFVICLASLNLFISSMHMTTEEERYQYQYPITHWVMMGLKGVGSFDQAESTFTNSAGNYDEKQEANLEVIQQRLSDYGFGGMCKHLFDKAMFTWNDGSYWISHHIYNNTGDRNFLHEFVLMNGRAYGVFYCISSGMQIVILLMFCITSLYSVIKPRCDHMTLIRILIFGIALFLLVWETRSRYLFNFTPLFLIVAAQGMILSAKAFGRYVEKRRLRKTELMHKST